MAHHRPRDPPCAAARTSSPHGPTCDYGTGPTSAFAAFASLGASQPHLPIHLLSPSRQRVGKIQFLQVGIIGFPMTGGSRVRWILDD
jgi:hypothetical protein